MIHLSQIQTPNGGILGFTVEVVNCPDPDIDLTVLIHEGCTVRNDKVHYFKRFSTVNGYNAKRKALVLAELLCVGLVQKTDTMSVEEFEGE